MYVGYNNIMHEHALRGTMPVYDLTNREPSECCGRCPQCHIIASTRKNIYFSAGACT